MAGLLDRLLAPWRPPAPVIVLAEPITSEWQLVIGSKTLISAGALAANALTSSSLVNLLALDSPTLMQEWRLRALSVPLGVQIKQAAGEHPNAVVVVTATLRRGGQAVLQSAGSTERGSTTHNLTLTERLDPPIVLRAGQALTLEVSASCYEAVESLSVNVGRFGAAEASEAVEGTLDYQTVNFSGARVL